MADGKVEIDTGINTDGIKKGAKETQKELNSLGKKAELWAKKFQDDFKKSSVPLTELNSAIGIVTGTIGKGIEVVKNYCAAIENTAQSYNIQIRAEKQLEVAARNNPYLNNESVQSLKNFASSVQEYSEYGDEYLMPFMAQLANAGRTEKEIMDIITASADIAASGTMSFDSAVSSLNATFNGITGSLGKNIDGIKELTDEELKNGKAVELVAKSYQGMAKEIAEAVGGANQKGNTIGDLFEEIGKITKPISDEWHRFWNKFATWGISAIGSVNEALENMSRRFGGIKKQVDEGVKSLNTYNGLTGESSISKQKRDTLEWYKKELEYREKIGKLDSESSQVLREINVELGKRDRIENELNKISQMNIDELNQYYNKAIEQSGDYGIQLDRLKEKYSELFNMIENLENLEKGTNEYNDLENRIYSYSKNGMSSEYILSDYARIKRSIENVREQAQVALDRINEPIMSAEQKLKKYYLDVVEEKKKEIELRKKAGESIDEEAETLELAQEKTRAYLEYLKQGGIENNEVLEEINRTYEKLRRISNDSIAISAKDEYKESLKMVEREFEIRKKMNEKISEEEELEAKLNAKRQAYLNLRMSTKDSQISDNNAEISLEKVNREIGEMEKRLNELKNDNLRKFKELLSEISEEEEPIKKLRKTIEELENFSIQVKDEINSLSDKDNLSDRENERLSELNQAYDEYARKIEIVRKELKELEEQENKIEDKSLENAQKALSNLSEGINNLSNAMNNLSDMWKEQAQNEASIATANLEKQFEAGEISEEEYYKKKEKIEKEAAEKSYKMQMWAWSAQLLQIGASTAQAIVTALGTAPTPVGIALASTVGMLGAAQLATAIANKPIPPSFAGGGIVGGIRGASMGQDNTYAHVRTGEAIFNAKQQRELWNIANGRNERNSNNNVVIKNYRGNDTKVSSQFSEDGLKIFVRRIVQEDFENGNMNDSLLKAENSFDGNMYI